jgi:hypothetical protein
VVKSAAEAWLGPELETLRQELEQRWHKDVDATWRQRHEKSVALNHRLSRIDNTVPDSTQNADALWDRARVILELEGDQAAEPLLANILALNPKHLAGLFQLGRILLKRGDAQGIGLLKQAMDLEDECIPQGCNLLHAYFRETGQAERLRDLNVFLDRHEKAVAASAAERQSVSASDVLIPHELTPDELRDLQSILSADPRVFQAHLARKQLVHFPKQRLFVLTVQTHPRWFFLPTTDADRQLVEALIPKVRLPGRVFICSPNGSFRALARKVAQVEGAKVTV